MTRMSRAKAKEQAQSIVDQLSLLEKVYQLCHIAPAVERLEIQKYHYWNEGLHGVARAGIATVFPQAIGLAASFDPCMLKEVANCIGVEGRAKYNDFQRQQDYGMYKGLTYWSPNVNIFRDPRWGRGHETYGEDPYLTSCMAVSYIEGLQGEGKYLQIAACAKHFAVHSGPEEGRHSFDSIVSDKDLFETYLPAFEASVREANVESIMAAYNSINGVPAPVNHRLLEAILRTQWGFDGHVVSDAGALTDVHKYHQYTSNAKETMALALQAGCDCCVDNIVEAVFGALKDGLIKEADVDRSLVRLLTTRVMLGMFAEDCEYDAIPYNVVECKEHLNKALEATYKSMVLLKNEDNFLPLNQDKVESIAVIGPNAASIKALEGNYAGTASKYHTFLSGLQDFMTPQRVRYAEGCHLYKSSVDAFDESSDRLSEAVAQTMRSDLAIVCLGLDPTIEGEQGDANNRYGSGDRIDLNLPETQLILLRRLVELDKPIILVISAGSAVTMDGLEKHPNIRGIIHTWYPGAQGGEALAKVLFGQASPSGKLPVTFYESICDLPEFEDYSMKNRTYKFFEGPVLYPFGYGLTYSSSKINKAEIVSWHATENRAVIQVEIENTGERNLEEVIEVYLSNNALGADFRYQLVDFQRVLVRPGEKQNQVFELSEAAFTIITEEGQRIVAGDQYTVYIGISQPDQRSSELTGKQPLEILLSR